MTHNTEPVRCLYSVGHSNQTFEAFLELLRKHGIEAVADVRSQPFSKYVPHFNREPFAEALKRADIAYVYVGEELGGRPASDEYYDAEGRVLYGEVARSALFLAGIERIRHALKKFRTALMCSEEDPANCHRHLLIGRVLRDCGLPLIHIRGDGRIQAESDFDQHKQLNLFGSRESEWKSIRSVSRRGPQKTSSEH